MTRGPLDSFLRRRCMTPPAVSVLMSVRDGAPWVRDAVQSVLDQSGGRSRADRDRRRIGRRDARAARRHPGPAAPRRAPPAAGLTASLNRALALARAPLSPGSTPTTWRCPSAWRASEDFLDAHPDVGLLGTGAREVDAAGRAGGVVDPARGRPRHPPRADPAQPLRALVGDDAPAGPRPGRRLRPGAARGPGLRALDADEPGDPPRQPCPSHSSFAGSCPAASRPRATASAWRPRRSCAGARCAERPLSLVVRGLSRPAARRAPHAARRARAPPASPLAPRSMPPAGVAR